MKRIKHFFEKWGAFIIFMLFLLLGIYFGWWVFFLKPVIALISTTSLGWSELLTCLFRFIIGDVICGIFWAIGGVITMLLCS